MIAQGFFIYFEGYCFFFLHFMGQNFQLRVGFFFITLSLEDLCINLDCFLDFISILWSCFLVSKVPSLVSCSEISVMYDADGGKGRKNDYSILFI